MKRKDRSIGMWFGVVLAFTMLSTGCTSAFLTAAYLFGGDMTPAAFKDLKGKKVVVVCRPQVQLPIGGQDAAQKLAKRVGQLLKQHVSKIEVVDHGKVADWMDNHSLMGDDSTTEYVKVGRAMEADMVVSIDLMEFDIREGQTLLRGKSQYELKVIDVNSTEELFCKMPDRTIWPPNTGVPTMNQGEKIFQRKFVDVLANEITRYFYRHDGRSEFAGDIKALE